MVTLNSLNLVTEPLLAVAVNITPVTSNSDLVTVPVVPLITIAALLEVHVIA